MMTDKLKTFHCKDVGYKCDWQVEGPSEENLLPIIEKHAAEVHDLTRFKPEAVENVLAAIRRNG